MRTLSESVSWPTSARDALKLVAQICNLLYRRFAIGTPRPGRGTWSFRALAGFKPAIRQIENLRYGVALAACTSLLPVSIAIAHEGPEHEIEELTERIKIEGETADLLLQRAIEYNVLGKVAEATKDLERALYFESHSPIIQRELSRTYFAGGKTNEAFDIATRGLKYAAEGAEHASILMVRCEILRARKDYQKALDDADKAIHEHPDNAEWYVVRSLLEQQLGLKKERVKGLEDGIKATGSGLLEVERIDALIDAGQNDAALAKIEAELHDARLQSSWLLRRAKVRLALKKKDDATNDLTAALTELNQRLGRAATDPLLLADRGQVHELLGNRDEAKKDFESARDKGVTDEWVREHIKAIDKKKEDEKKKGEKKGDAKKDTEKKDAEQKTDEPKDDNKDNKEEPKPDGDEPK